MSVPYYRLSDADLLIWSDDFSGRLTSGHDEYGVSAEQAAAYAALNTNFDNALKAWRNNMTRTPVSSAVKSAARVELLAMARFLVNSINSNPATTDAQRDELGIRGRKRPSPVPVPASAPIIDVINVNGRRVSIGLHSTEGSKRGKPAGVKGASIFTWVGDDQPSDPSMWKFEGLITKTRFELNFEQSTQSNTAWVTVKWFNERGEAGLASAPIRINLPAGNELPRNQAIKFAA